MYNYEIAKRFSLLSKFDLDAWPKAILNQNFIPSPPYKIAQLTVSYKRFPLKKCFQFMPLAMPSGKRFYS